MIIFRQILGLFFLLCWTSLSAQFKPMILSNASFEGVPHDAVTPDNWQACGLDSSPDILPGPWGVYQKPTEGTSFVGLITRDDNTWEALGQKMPRPFKKERCYKFKVDLSSSPAYAGYAEPTCLRVWVGNSACDRAQLIAISPTIDHYEWKTYEFLFSTEDDYKYIIIECYYKQPSINYYKGNLLIDNISAFEMCDRA